jgi:2-dehydropantoate 2-reductase
MNIAVLGIGGVGGFFGGKLAHTAETGSGLHVSFIARGMHLREIQKNGLLLDTDDGRMVCMPQLATDNINEIPVPDLCLVCVKSFDLEAVLHVLKDKVTDKTIILPLLNGVDVYERVRAVIKTGVVLPSCVYIGTHIERPGEVRQRGGSCTIHLGKDPYNDYMDNRIPEIFTRAGIKYNLAHNAYPEIWGKYIFIAAFGLVTAYSGKSIGQVLESQELSGYVKSIMDEVAAIAMAKNVQLSESAAGDAFLKGKNFPYETKTSFQRDFEVIDKPDERDLFGGTIIRLGKELGIAVPAADFIYAELNKIKPAL